MSMHLEEIAFHVAPGAHAVLLLDQAGWHGSAELVVPANITLMPLPPRCPELNPVENVLAVHARQLAVEPHLQILR
jgi:transposase